MPGQANNDHYVQVVVIQRVRDIFYNLSTAWRYQTRSGYKQVHMELHHHLSFQYGARNCLVAKFKV